MKVIPKNELIALINAWPSNLIFNSTIDELFKIYGDDYFREPGEDWDLVNKNKDRAEWLALQEPKT